MSDPWPRLRCVKRRGALWRAAEQSEAKLSQILSGLVLDPILDFALRFEISDVRRDLACQAISANHEPSSR